jgi:hypothetical protein
VGGRDAGTGSSIDLVQLLDRLDVVRDLRPVLIHSLILSQKTRPSAERIKVHRAALARRVGLEARASLPAPRTSRWRVGEGRRERVARSRATAGQPGERGGMHQLLESIHLQGLVALIQQREKRAARRESRTRREHWERRRVEHRSRHQESPFKDHPCGHLDSSSSTFA